MKLSDIHSETTAGRLVDPAAVIATGALGQAFDTQGYQDRLKLIAVIGAVTGTTPTLDIKVQDCDTSGGTYADLVTPVTFAQLVTASANTVAAIGVDTQACRRYIKLYATAAGTSPSFTMGVTVVGQKQVI